MFVMRLRLPELMQRAGYDTAYALAKASKGRLPLTTAHRLVSAEGKPKRVDLATLDVICDILNAKPSELLERDKPERR